MDHHAKVKVAILPLRRAIPTKSAISLEPETSPSSSDATIVPSKRVRASKPKVKTGCLTCKIRKIKCDETKPACLKCTSTGRKCDGYASFPLKNVNRHPGSTDTCHVSEPIKGLALSPTKASSGELRALEYFCCKTAPGMGMYFDGDFWSQFIVQASVAEPALRHAMVAAGAFAQQREFVNTNRTTFFNRQKTPGPGKFVALQSYNQSIGLLANRVASSPESTDVTLLACILFVCIEFLRGDEETAIRHFRGGMAIIIDLYSRHGSPRSSGALTKRFKSDILPFFNRLEMLHLLFGNDAPWSYPVSIPASLPANFCSLAHARDSLVHLMNYSLRFVRTMQCSNYELHAMPSSAAFDEQATLLRLLQLWRERFSAYLAERPHQWTANALYAANVLEIQRLVSYTWVSACVSPFECAHDPHIPTYETVVSLAERLSGIAETDTQRARYIDTFLFDMEIVGPVYLVAAKCRDPVVRRRAIAVLRSTHRREGMWDSEMTAAAAERIVAIEEANSVQVELLPSEESRVHLTLMRSESRHDGLKQYIFTHHTKPDGVHGGWSILQECV